MYFLPGDVGTGWLPPAPQGWAALARASALREAGAKGLGLVGSVPARWPCCLARGLPARKVLRFVTIHGRNRLVWPADASEQ